MRYDNYRLKFPSKAIWLFLLSNVLMYISFNNLVIIRVIFSFSYFRQFFSKSYAANRNLRFRISSYFRNTVTLIKKSLQNNSAKPKNVHSGESHMTGLCSCTFACSRKRSKIKPQPSQYICGGGLYSS